MKQNPVYIDTLKQWKAKPSSTVWIDTANVAKLIRSQLKAKFPKCTFSVTISRYSGGSSVRINWEDGPVRTMVEAIVDQYQGKGFDGMQDMEYSKGAWLMPDGSAQFRRIASHWGANEVAYEAEKDGSIPVSMGSCYTFCERSVSMPAMKRAIASYAARYPGDDLSNAIKSGEVDVTESDFRGWKFTGSPEKFKGMGMGSQYDGHCALISYAARRMVAA